MVMHARRRIDCELVAPRMFSIDEHTPPEEDGGIETMR
jgi:hypothetical protein